MHVILKFPTISISKERPSFLLNWLNNVIFTYFQVSEAEEVLIDEPVQLADGEQIITDEQQVKLTLVWYSARCTAVNCFIVTQDGIVTS